MRRALLVASVAAAIVGVACAGKSGPDSTAAPPAAVTPPPAAAAPPPPAATPPAAAPTTPPAAAPAQHRPPLPAPRRRRRSRRRGGRGTPPPPPPSPPAVMPAPVTPIVSAKAPITGSARWPEGRLLGCRAGGVEPEAGVHDAAVETVPRRDQLRPRVPRQVHRPGELQRLPGVGHLEPSEAELALTYVCPASQSDVSVYRNLLFVSGEGKHRPRGLRHPGRAGAGEQGSPARHPRVRHQRHQQA